MKIEKITAREILDSRGNPTVSATVFLEDGSLGESRVPSGASTGSEEACELRDDDPKRYNGLGVLKAVSNVERVISPTLIGLPATEQGKIDNLMIELDGTKNKGKLGANAILAVSMAVSKAAAVSLRLELFDYLAQLFGNKNSFKLPTPMLNILNGGRHAENSIDIQEAMIVPVGFKKFSQKIETGSEVYHILRKELKDANLSVGLGDEGGFAPDLEDNESVFALIKKAIQLSGYKENEIRISTDMAATEFFDSKKNIYKLNDQKSGLTSAQLIKKVVLWAKKYNLLTVEDGLSERDSEWSKLTRAVSPTITIGDDLFTTNPQKIKEGLEEKQAGGIIIKPNQIGTVTETLEAIKIAQDGGMKIVVSHRSGETEDTFIADLAVAVGAEYIKSGAPARSERLAKYNRLLQIEEIIEKR